MKVTNLKQHKMHISQILGISTATSVCLIRDRGYPNNVRHLECPLKVNLGLHPEIPRSLVSRCPSLFVFIELTVYSKRTYFGINVPPRRTGYEMLI